jgi:hypothetical protein
MSRIALIPLAAMARQLHVKPSWLADEARAGRVPHLEAGDRLLFHPPAVEKVLLARAIEQEKPEAANAG